jgi:hypothetical protein
VQEKGAEFVADGQSPWVKTYVRAHLYAHGVKVWNNATVDSVTDESVTITLNASGLKHVIPCDTVIECWDMVPNMELFDEIKAAGFEVYAAGCDEPKTIQSAIHSGYAVSRYLD